MRKPGAAQKWAHTMCRVDLRTGGMADGTEFFEWIIRKKKHFQRQRLLGICGHSPRVVTNTNAS
jgi:hypothetical protein